MQVTPYFSTKQNLQAKFLGKDKNWNNLLKKPFWEIRRPEIIKYTVARKF